MAPDKAAFKLLFNKTGTTNHLSCSFESIARNILFCFLIYSFHPKQCYKVTCAQSGKKSEKKDTIKE